MDEILKNIYERRAVRKYKDTPVAKGLIDQMIAAGCMAPSAMNRQPWKFYILMDKEKIKLLSKEIAPYALNRHRQINIRQIANRALDFLHISNVIESSIKGDDIFYNAPVVIFITAPRIDEWGTLDVGMCAQNIMLAARAVGLDTCPVEFAKYAVLTKNYDLLNIPDTEQVELAIVVGYADEQPKAYERAENNAIYLS